MEEHNDDMLPEYDFSKAKRVGLKYIERIAPEVAAKYRHLSPDELREKADEIKREVEQTGRKFSDGADLAREDRDEGE